MNCSNTVTATSSDIVRRLSAVLMAGAAGALAVGMVAAPLVYGATEVWSSCVLQVLAAIAALLWLASPRADTRLLLVPGLAVLLGLLQIVPLPQVLLGLISPLAHESALAVGTLQGPAPLGCVSVNPAATLASARQLFLFAMVTLVAAQAAQVRPLRFGAAWLLAIIGVAVLALGIVYPRSTDRPALGIHDLSGPFHKWKNPLLPALHGSGCGFTDMVLVRDVSYAVDWSYSGDPTGPFLVSNHFAGFANLALPVAMGLLLSCRGSRWISRLFVFNHPPECQSKPEAQAKVEYELPSLARQASMVVLTASAACGVTVAVALCSNSRAGVASLVVGACATLCLQASRRSRWFFTALLAVTVTGFAVLFAVAAGWLPSAVVGGKALPPSARAALARFGYAARVRIAATEMSGAMFLQAPLAGTGLGTFVDIHHSFLRTEGNVYFAHNEFAQFAGEAGLLGLALVGVAVLVVGGRVFNGWKNLATEADRALCAGLGGAAFGFGLHCIFEWNLHVPANGFVFAVLIGMLLGVTSAAPPVPRPCNRRRQLFVKLGFATLLAASVLGAVRDSWADRLMQPLRIAVMKQRVVDERASPSDKTEVLRGAAMTEAVEANFARALPGALRAAALDPWNADYAGTIGQAYLHLSEGRKSPELILAQEWFARSLGLCPAKRSLHATVAQVQDALCSPAP